MKYNRIAILTRTNADIKQFEPYLIREKIPYELHPKAHKFLERSEVKLAFGFLLLLGRPDDSIAFEIALETLEGFGEKIISDLREAHRASRLSLKAVCEKVLNRETIKAVIIPKIEESKKGGAGAKPDVKIEQQNNLTKYLLKRPPVQKLEKLEEESKAGIESVRKEIPSAADRPTEYKLKLSKKQEPALRLLLNKIKQYKDSDNEE